MIYRVICGMVGDRFDSFNTAVIMNVEPGFSELNCHYFRIFNVCTAFVNICTAIARTCSATVKTQFAMIKICTCQDLL